MLRNSTSCLIQLVTLAGFRILASRLIDSNWIMSQFSIFFGPQLYRTCKSRSHLQHKLSGNLPCVYIDSPSYTSPANSSFEVLRPTSLQLHFCWMRKIARIFLVPQTCGCKGLPLPASWNSRLASYPRAMRVLFCPTVSLFMVNRFQTDVFSPH
jgi:hypothetical protein